MPPLKRKTKTKIVEDDDSNDKNFAKTSKINDIDLDFSGDPNIPEKTFIETYMKELKKINPRTDHCILQYHAEQKYRKFNPDSDKRRKPNRSETPVVKTYKKEVSESESETPSHNEICEFCDKPGELLLCDFCNAAFHIECVNLTKEELPEGEWECPLCVKDNQTAKANAQKPKGRVAKSEKAVDENPCYHCAGIDASVLCNTCNKLFHLTCTFPPIKTVPAKWKCQYCSADPIARSIEKIIFFKFVSVPFRMPNSSEKKEYPVKKFLVKYNELSYWDVDWVDEFQLKRYSYPMFAAFGRKYDLTVSMCYDDSDTVADTTDPCFDLNDITDADLYKTFFIYGVKPEWLQIQRVISIKKLNEKILYLIKWRDLPHVNCTWEDRKRRHLSEICGIKKYIHDFQNLIKEAIDRPIKFDNCTLKGKEYQAYKSTPEFIKTPNLNLHEYQLIGLNWIRLSCFSGTNVILADEMGLGKTIQSITFLYSLYKEKISPGPFLVVAPLSTLPNWEREFEVWAPDFYVVSISMSRENRDFIKNEEFFLNRCSPHVPRGSRRNLKFHVLLASYETIQIESSILKSIKWSVLVLDEAHRIKNKQSKLHQMLAEYKFQFKLLLTGTPLQNNLEELFYLLNFLCNNEFNSLENFQTEFKDLSKEAQIDKLHNLLCKRLLRRLKTDVLKEIPVKSEIIVPVDLCPLQKKYYKAILTKNYSTLVQRNTSSSILNILMELKKCCNHPYLFNLTPEEEPYNEETGLHEYDKLVNSCAKMILLDKMLEGLKKLGHRVLIFSQMTRLLDLLEEYITHKDWKFERIDGSVNTLQRQASIDRFNSKDSNSFIFLLSTRAGGLGINLASADTVIIYDSDWNPHNDIQALSRAHRLGQLKKVMIYRFFTRNSVEERILEVAKKKMMLTHLVVTASLGKTENLNKRELEDIVRFGTAQLFTNQDDSNQLEYDENAVNQLLNREAHTNVTHESGIEEYFASFKIVDVAVKQPVAKEPVVDPELDANVDSSRYWTTLLKGENELEKEIQLCAFGKGKRQRKQIKYVEQEPKDNEDVDFDRDSDYNADNRSSSSSSSEESGSAEVSNTEETPSLSKPRVYNKDVFKMPLGSAPNVPPTTVNVAELTRKRKILNKLATFGIPTDIEYCYKSWEMNEENFSLDDFKNYIKNIFSSLDYTGSRFVRQFDKFPLDDYGCQSVLSRISLMELMKAKVLEYAPHLPYMLPILIDHHLIKPESLDVDYLEVIKPYLKEGVSLDDTEKLSTKINIPKNHEEIQKTGSIFKFNIEDHNYTDLHCVWDAEQSMQNKNIWWRYHDLWLLLGICVHGYNEFSNIFNDARFACLHLAFQNSKEDKRNFSRRRLDLLEQALIIEDVVIRTIEQKIYLRPESNIIKMRNKIFEMNCLLEAGLSIAENYNGQEDSKRVLRGIVDYNLQICQDLKFDANQLSRYILSSSLRAVQLFPFKNVDKNSINTQTNEKPKISVAPNDG